MADLDPKPDMRQFYTWNGALGLHRVRALPKEHNLRAMNIQQIFDLKDVLMDSAVIDPAVSAEASRFWRDLSLELLRRIDTKTGLE